MIKDIKSFYVMIALVALIITSLACGSSTTEQLQKAVVPTSTTEEIAVEPTDAKIEEQKPTDEITTEAPPTEAPPTETSLPTEPPPTPTPIPEPIDVTNFGFGQEDRSAGYAFIVENPNQGLSFEGSQYQVAAYDENDVVVETDSGNIELLLPGQKLGIGGDLFLDEGVKIAKIDVQLNAGDPEATESITNFSVEKSTYYPDEYFSFVSGIINNPYDIDLSSLKVSAVVYDEAGNIIGGGYTYQNFILANSSSGVKVSINSAGEVAKAELYPTLSGLSTLSIGGNDIPEGAANILLKKYGFGQERRSAGIGMIIENQNNNYSIEGSEYHITGYSAEGTVVDTNEGYISLILPEQTLGISSDLYLNEGMEIDHIEVQLMPGEFVEAEPVPLFTYENVVFQAGSYSSKVTGIVVSPYTSDITDLRVSAIAYDENGEIIGSGYTFLDFAPANGKTAVEVSVTVDGSPDIVELFATVSSLSEFSE